MNVYHRNELYLLYLKMHIVHSSFSSEWFSLRNVNNSVYNIRLRVDAMKFESKTYRNAIALNCQYIHLVHELNNFKNQIYPNGKYINIIILFVFRCL